MESHLCSWTGKLNSVLRLQCSQIHLQINAISIKIPAVFFFFTKMNKLTLKLIWKCKWPRIAKLMLKKENTVGGLILSNAKLTINI